MAALCRPADVWPGAGIVAGELRVRAGSGVAVVVAWIPGGFEEDMLAPPFALPAARRAAQRLSERGLRTIACGAVCRVLLPAEPEEAVRSARTAIAAAGAPVVVALGLNASEFAGLLAVVEQTYVMPSADDSASLYELAPSGSSVRIVPVPSTPLARLRARLAFARIPPVAAPGAPPVPGLAPGRGSVSRPGAPPVPGPVPARGFTPRPAPERGFAPGSPPASGFGPGPAPARGFAPPVPSRLDRS